MYILGKYYLFIALGILIIFIPLIVKLSNKKRYGTMAFLLVTVLATLIISGIYIYQQVYKNYF